MKRFLNILYFVSLSILALGQSTQGDSFFFMDAGVNVITETSPQAPKIDTVVVVQRDTLVQYEEYAGNESQVPMLVQNSAQERRLFGMKKYSYGDTQMDEKALEIFFRNNNREVYLKYMKNKNIKTAGWSLFGGGLALIFTGGMCNLHEDFMEYYDADGHYHYWYEPSNEGAIAGYALWPIGIVSVVTSIPLLCVGYNNKNVIQTFNDSNSRPAITLGLTSSKNGIGLALNF